MFSRTNKKSVNFLIEKHFNWSYVCIICVSVICIICVSVICIICVSVICIICVCVSSSEKLTFIWGKKSLDPVFLAHLSSAQDELL